VVMQMVLHYAEDPAGALAEATRVLAPAGRLLVVDLAAHASTECMQRLAHRWPGFTDAAMHGLLAAAGLEAGPTVSVPGPLEVRIWTARAAAAATPATALVLESSR